MELRAGGLNRISLTTKIIILPQTGADEFRVINDTMIFSATVSDVNIMIKKRGDSLPKITNVLVVDGTLPADAAQEEYCECQCGMQNEAVPIILGGTEAREGEWPWNAGTF